MSNPNMQKIGQRKMAPGKQQQQPDWLFPAAGKSSQISQSQPKNQKKLAKDLLKRRAAGAAPKTSPPAQLVRYVFLELMFPMRYKFKM
jgi:hypothetical protein